MRSRVAPRGIVVILAAVLCALAWNAAANDGTFEVSISGLRSLSENLDALSGGDLKEWASSKIQEAVHSALPEEVERPVTAGEHKFAIQSRAFDAMREMDSASSSGEAKRKEDEFWSWLNGEKLPELVKDSLSEKMRSAMESAEWMTEGAERVAESAEQLKARLGAYFSVGGNYGLEPGASDASLAMQSTESSGAKLAPSSEQVDDAAQLLARQAPATQEGMRADEIDPRVDKPLHGQWTASDTAAPAPVSRADDPSSPPSSQDAGTDAALARIDVDEVAGQLGVGSDDANGRADLVSAADVAAAESQQWKADQEVVRREHQRLALEQQARERALQAAQAQSAMQDSQPFGDPDAAEDSSDSSGWTVAGELMKGVASAYIQRKTGVPLLTGPLASRESGPVDVSGCNSFDARASARYESCMERAMAAQSNCETARLAQQCATMMATQMSECPQMAAEFRSQAESAATTASGFCSDSRSSPMSSPPRSDHGCPPGHVYVTHPPVVGTGVTHSCVKVAQ